MNLSAANKELWLWLHRHGGHWTCEQMARRTGYASQNIFRALHDMHRRKLVEQIDAAPGEHRKRYGVTDTCLVPLGLTVAEVMLGQSVSVLSNAQRRHQLAGVETSAQIGPH